jgi:hypothetical protein
MTKWPQYSSSKVVRAAKIVHIDEGAVGGRVLFVDPFDGGVTEPFQATLPDMTARAEVGWWAMIYADDFKSVSPPKQFEDGYTRID